MSDGIDQSGGIGPNDPADPNAADAFGHPESAPPPPPAPQPTPQPAPFRPTPNAGDAPVPQPPPWRPAPAIAGGDTRKGKGGAGPWLGLVFAVLIVGSCLFMGMAVLGGPAMGGGGQVQTHSVPGGGDGPDKVAVIPIKGMISQGGAGSPLMGAVLNSVAQTRKFLERAKEDDAVKAVILDINSPGGEVTACDLIWQDIVRFKKETGKPVIAYLEGAAASGGYYVAAPCDAIVCYRTTITGSIGVRMSFMNFADLAKQYGVKDYAITSGDHKDMGSMTREPSAEDLAILQGLVDDMYATFLEVVTTGRNLPVEQVKPLADGRILTAKQALDGKLVDEIGGIDAAIRTAESKAGITNATVFRYSRQPTFFDLMGAKMAQPSTPQPSALLQELQRLASPRLMYHLVR
jgi:protease-4